jgi:hypothetical protein
MGILDFLSHAKTPRRKGKEREEKAGKYRHRKGDEEHEEGD